MRRTLIITTMLLAFTGTAHAGRLLDLGRAIEQSVRETGIDMAQLDVSKSTESQAARREAEEAVRAAERRLREITEEISELIKLGEEIEKEKAQLSKERDRLVIEKVEILKAKADVEKREELFSMGFYTTFLTSVIAFAGLAIRIPNSRLERRLKVLEIEAKEYELEQLRTQD